MAITRYERALQRNLAELQKALLIRETLLGIEKHRHIRTVFMRIIRDALQNDYISHAIKLFDRNTKSSTFWYVYRTDPTHVNNCALKSSYSIDRLESVAEKLKKIRDGTHFHIDSHGVLDTRAIWSAAGLTGNDLAGALDFAWKALSLVQNARGGEVPSLLGYTSADALAAIEKIEGITLG